MSFITPEEFKAVLLTGHVRTNDRIRAVQWYELLYEEYLKKCAEQLTPTPHPMNDFGEWEWRE
jgi:hypothetical protein